MSVLSNEPMTITNISDWYKVSIEFGGWTPQDYTDWHRYNRSGSLVSVIKVRDEKEILEQYRETLRKELLDIYMENPTDIINWQPKFHKIFVTKVAQCWCQSLERISVNTDWHYLSTPNTRGAHAPYIKTIEIRCRISKKYEKSIMIDLEPRMEIIDAWADKNLWVS